MVEQVVAVQNGLLYVPTRKVVDHTPRFWSPNVLEFKYNRSARAPRFERFLEEVWPEDKSAREALLQLFGLCLTDETRYQKMFMFVGPPRGGRGTIGRVLKGLIGEANYVGANLGSFGEQFGMQSWIGKKVAVFSDARLDGLRREKLSTITERLLKITGEDDQDIPRKFLGTWQGVLKARVIIFSNELLRFMDESGALAGRIISWRMRVSFRGREDLQLTEKLLAERAGIMNLSLDALDRLRAERQFAQPTSGEEMSEEMGELNADVATFVADRCVLDTDRKVLLNTLYLGWRGWCELRGVNHGWTDSQFSAKLCSAFPTLRRGRPRETASRQVMVYGIGLR
jgi:putative DNA primase/helicase